MTDTITLPRSVLEQALEALETGIQYDYHGNPYSDNDAARCGAYDALRAALEQPQGEVVVTTNQQGHCVAVTRQDEEGRILSVVWESKQPQVEQEQILDMVPDGWKLVPVEPTNKMAVEYWKYNDRTDVVMRDAWKALLAAAPQPPVVEQPQVEQPVAWCHLHYYEDGSYFADCLQHYQDNCCKTPLYPHPQPQVEQEPIGKAHEWNNSEGFTYCIWDARVVPIGTKLYTHPQPPRQPLTCNSCKGLGRVYRGCNEWAACAHCNTTGIGGEK